MPNTVCLNSKSAPRRGPRSEIRHPKGVAKRNSSPKEYRIAKRKTQNPKLGLGNKVKNVRLGCRYFKFGFLMSLEK